MAHRTIGELQFELERINKVIEQLDGMDVLNVGGRLKHGYDTYSFKRFPVIMPVHRKRILNILKAEALYKKKTITVKLEKLLNK